MACPHKALKSVGDALDTPGDARSEMPSRTSILVAAIRAFGSREPDECVRNPDVMADLLIGPAELALIKEHPASRWLSQDYEKASQNPAMVLFADRILRRTRYIDETMTKAVEDGVRQIVVLGAGFDSRAYRFRELLSGCRVIEVDAAQTQSYKKRRLQTLMPNLPGNVAYCEHDFLKDNLMDGLRRVGFQGSKKAFYIWEGVCMYLPENSVRSTLSAITAGSAPGSTLVLDYANELGIELRNFFRGGTGGIPAAWGERWIFGVPESNGSQFFRALGFDPGTPLAVNDAVITRRYATRRDGTSYAAHVLKGSRLQSSAGSPVAAEALLARRGAAKAGGTYWFTELKVMNGKTAIIARQPEKDSMGLDRSSCQRPTGNAVAGTAF